jgi:sugar lactone lactonase YvrE
MMETRHLNLIGAISAAMTLGGCGASSTSALPRAQNAPPQSELRDASGKQRTLFVADVANNVLLYTANINEQNPPLLGQITEGVTRSVGICFANGTLYVVNSGGSRASVAEYHRGSSSPFATITSGLDTPDACTVDRDGNLYVDDGGAGHPLIQMYPAGSSTPGKTIDLPPTGRATAPGGLVLNRRGVLFVSIFTAESETATVFRIDRGSSKAKNLHLQQLPAGGALGIDNAGNLYTGGHEGDVAIYAPGGTTPSRTFALNTDGFYTDMAVTPNGTIYWPNYDEGAMYEFAPGASSPTNDFSTAGSGIGAAIGGW